MKGLTIINLYKHNIVHKNVKKFNQKKLLYSCMTFFIIAGTLLYLNQHNIGIKKAVASVNPISELYREVDYLSFVDATNNNFIVPIKTDEFVQNDNNIKFKVISSIMIYAPASGVIDRIDNSHNKTIRIKHSSDLYSIIENVDIVGVKTGDIVKQGKEIATAKVGSTITLMIEYKDKIVDNIYINKSFVKWEITD